MKRISILLILLILSVWQVSAQVDYDAELYGLYLSGRMKGWESVMLRMETQAAQSADMKLLFDLLLAEYGYIGYCLSQDLTDKASVWLEKAENHLDKLLSKEPSWSRPYALKGAFYGFRISLRPSRAVIEGPKSLRNIEKAIDLDPSEPMAWFEYGNAEFYRPAAFGGSKTRGIDHYEKAIGFYEKNNAKISDNWYYIHMLMILVSAYETTSQPEKARETCQKILRVEPRFEALKEKVN